MISRLVFRYYFKGDRCGMPFLLCKSFLGFNPDFTCHALISSVDSAIDMDDFISLVLGSTLWFSFHEISFGSDFDVMHLQLWLLSSTGTIETWKSSSMAHLHVIYVQVNESLQVKESFIYFASDRTEAVWQVLYVSPTSFTSTSKLQFCRWFRVFRLWPGTQMNSLLPIYLISLVNQSPKL